METKNGDEMLENLTLLRTASAMARHATFRHSVIAENIANADTPGYRARDIAAFSTDMVTTRTGREAGIPGRAGTVLADMPVSPNGNSVSLEDQAVRSAEAKAQYDLALTILSKGMDFLRISLGRGR